MENGWLKRRCSLTANMLCRFAILACVAVIVPGIGLARKIKGPLGQLKRGSPGQWINTHVLEAPLLRHHRASAWSWGSWVVLRLPGRIHTMLLLCLWGINIAGVCLYHYPLPPGSEKVIGSLSDYYVRTAADRLGVLSLLQLPCVFLFAGHNAIPLRLSRCSFNTLMLYHRHWARIVTMEAILHAVLYRAHALHFEGTLERWKNTPWLMAGVKALYLFMLIAILSYTPIRQWAYEVSSSSSFGRRNIH